MTSNSRAEHDAASGRQHAEEGPMGMPRLSCRFCVLASKSALVRAAQLDPAGAEKRARMEERMNHTFRKGLPMREIIAAAEASPEPVPVMDWAA